MMAFFIMLNTYSSDNAAKLASVKDSLQASFGFVVTGRSDVMTDEDSAGQIKKIEKDTAAGLRSVLPDLNFQTRKTAGGGVIMSVDIPPDSLADRWPDLRTRIGDLLVNKTKGQRYELQMLTLNGPKGTGGLAGYASDLSDEGVDNDIISIGYEDQGRNEIELRFVLVGR